MNLEEAKNAIESVERNLDKAVFVEAASFERDDRKLKVAITERLKRACKRGKVWKSKAFLTAFKNAEYGYDEKVARSVGGKDGIFLLTREYRPANVMMKKIFDRFLDHSDGSANKIAKAMGVERKSLMPVRLVSHHLRLLGVLAIQKNNDLLVLVDYDNTK